MTVSFAARLAVVSIINYLFGNILFALIWQFFQNTLSYWQIAVVCTSLGSIFSFQTQSRFILRENIESYINIRFILFQLVGLGLAFLLVPRLSAELSLNLVLVHFGWSGLFSIVSLLLLGKRKFHSFG